MKIIRTNFFNNQVLNLSKKYNKIFDDLSNFESNFKNEPFSDLWNNILKFRLKNSSVPVWKRWWFRLIIKLFWNKILPILIYSKNSKENVFDNEIEFAFEKVLSEL